MFTLLLFPKPCNGDWFQALPAGLETGGMVCQPRGGGCQLEPLLPEHPQWRKVPSRSPAGFCSPIAIASTTYSCPSLAAKAVCAISFAPGMPPMLTSSHAISCKATIELGSYGRINIPVNWSVSLIEDGPGCGQACDKTRSV